MQDLLALLFIALVCTGMGFAAGLLYGGVRAGKNALSEPPVQDALDVVHLWRARRSGRLWPVIAGRKFAAADELSPAQRARLEQAAAELQTWLGSESRANVSESDLADAEPGGRHVDPQAAPGGEWDPDAPHARRGFEGADPRTAVEAAQPPAAPGFRPVEVLARALNPKAGHPVVEPRSLAEEVDEILQQRLARSGQPNRAVRLMEMPGRGLVVLIGVERYDGLDAVPDPDVRELIHSCVKEWEQKRGAV